jgi:hypothetical protein
VLERLETWPSKKHVVRITVTALCAFLVFYILMQMASQPLRDDSPYDTIDLEFAWDSDRMDTILEDWGDELIDHEIQVTYLDFGFLAAYGTLLAGLSLLVARSVKRERLGGIGLWAVIVSYASAVFDTMENILILMVLYSPDSYPTWIPFLISICASVKFTFVICAIAYIVTGAIVLGYDLVRVD